MIKSNMSERHCQMFEQCNDNERAYLPMFAGLKDMPEVTLGQIKRIVKAHKKKLDWTIRLSWD